MLGESDLWGRWCKQCTEIPTHLQGVCEPWDLVAILRDLRGVHIIKSPLKPSAHDPLLHTRF